MEFTLQRAARPMRQEGSSNLKVELHTRRQLTMRTGIQFFVFYFLSSIFYSLSASPVDVFVNGQEGYPVYRIPSILATQRGSLLAFAEGRISLRDHSENDIVMKRSDDGGATWSVLRVIAEDGTNALNNPTVVQARKSGTILLVYQRYAKGFDEKTAESGLDGSRICRTLIRRSENDGKSWSQAVDITGQVKPVEATSTASGPGIGIQLTRGKHASRVLIPFNHGPYGKWKVYAAISDDEGESWRMGRTAPEGSPGFANEVQFVEWADGSVMLNARIQGGAKVRKVALSRDGGETWSPTQEVPALIDPVCQASLLRHPGADGREMFLFSNPASQTGRSNGTVRVSWNEGRTWPVSRVIYPGSFGYSCLTSFEQGAAGCLFERDQYSRISFVRLPLEGLKP